VSLHLTVAMTWEVQPDPCVACWLVAIFFSLPLPRRLLYRKTPTHKVSALLKQSLLKLYLYISASALGLALRLSLCDTGLAFLVLCVFYACIPAGGSASPDSSDGNGQDSFIEPRQSRSEQLRVRRLELPDNPGNSGGGGSREGQFERIVTGTGWSLARSFSQVRHT
jgi:hypothetical protein